jgi:hypothetical protein
MWDAEMLDLDLFYYMILEFDDLTAFGVPPDDSDITFGGAAATFELGDANHTIEPYALLYRDGDYALGGGKLYTYGVHYAHTIDADDEIEGSAWDWNVEAAMQSGDLAPGAPGEQSFGGSIVEGWLGYNFGSKESRHRVHLGLLWASGDDDLTDDDFDSFVALFPDEHDYNRLGDTDVFGGSSASNYIGSSLTPGFSILSSPISNVIDINAGYEWWGGKHMFMAAVHNLQLSEDDVTGAFTADESSIGTELDLRYGYQYTDHLAFEAGVANLFTGDALEVLTAPDGADDIARAWWQFRLAW